MGSVEAEKISLRQALMLVYGCLPSSHFPSIATDQCCAIRYVRLFSPETFIHRTVDESTIHINPHMPRVYTRESDNVTTTKRPAFSWANRTLKIIDNFAHWLVWPIVEYWAKIIATPKRKTIKTNRAIECPFVFIYIRRSCCISMRLQLTGIAAASTTIRELATWKDLSEDRKIIFLSRQYMVDWSQSRTMRSDVWHLCITQDEFGVRVSALAIKIKDSG